jgi:hypothetical protein
LEWDSYTFSVDTPGLSLVEVDPAQPVAVNPGESKNIVVYIDADNTLLVTVLESEESAPVFSAVATLTKTGFQDDELTDADGRALFFALSEDTYTLDVTATGYDPFQGPIQVSGETSTTVILDLNPE